LIFDHFSELLNSIQCLYHSGETQLNASRNLFNRKKLSFFREASNLKKKSLCHILSTSPGSFRKKAPKQLKAGIVIVRFGVVVFGAGSVVHVAGVDVGHGSGGRRQPVRDGGDVALDVPESVRGGGGGTVVAPLLPTPKL